MAKILVVDDEKIIVKGLKFSLEQEQLAVDCAYDGEQAIEMARKNRYDAILLDVMLPKSDGYTVCRKIREFSEVPIIMLTAKGDDMDKILGFDYGADDYITKPFNVLEVKARLKAVLRRFHPGEEGEQTNFIVVDRMVLNPENRSMTLDGEEVNLTAKEYELLELLVRNPGKVYSRENLLQLVWGYEYLGDARTVDVHIRRLREKIEENPSEPNYVITKWGVGYYFKK